MGNLAIELAMLSRIARPLEFDSGGTLIKGRHALVTEEILEGQHAVRAWEYSQAHRAREHWCATCGVPAGGFIVADVGGAGSNFYRTLLGLQPPSVGRVDIIDPAQALPGGGRGILHVANELPGTVRVSYPLDEWAGYKQNNAAYDAVFCISVIEHVKDPQRFLGDLGQLVRPGGLLFLTMDCGADRTDAYHFHWMREWIASAELLEQLLTALSTNKTHQFEPLGPWDFQYRGATVYDYTVASIAVRRALE